MTQNPHRAWGAVLLAAGLLAYGALALTAARRKSATFDEPLHLAAGYAHLALGDYRLVPQHPPLVKAWAALPLLVARPVFHEDDPNWREGLQRKLSRQFFYRWNDGERLLRRVRPLMVVLGGALIAAVFWWTRRGWGLAAAALALLLGVFNPDLLAHGPLVTTDVAVALLMFVTIVAFERLTSGVTPPRLLCAGLALGAAAAAKFSALSLLPMLAALSVVVALRRDPLAVRGFGPARVLETRRHKLVALSALLLAMALAAEIVVWATYGFTASARAYVEGLLYWSGGAAREGTGGGAFLLGRHSDRGWWYYFPVTFALKTPLPLIGLLALRLALWRRFHAGSRREWFLWLPVVVYLAIAMAFPLNIGHRHLLPLYPFLFVAAGSVAREAVRSRALGAAVGVLALWYVAGTLRVHPHHLAYFNEAAGGPANGYRLLVDSNLDWGQDLPGLKDYLDAHGIARVKLSYFGPADPAWFGIAHDPLPGFPPPAHVAAEVLPGELVAVSATNLQSVRLEQGRRLMRRLRETRPVGHVGYSILLFRP
ncbi:MAG TPA: hypothetical protein VFO85_01305, partial [Vicinamibacteria bacterium]|nr:hypothetical protein [Vicinamibacteria bacterium]